MSSILCYEGVEAGDGSRTEWRPVLDPPYLSERSGMLVAELPPSERGYPRAFVNGLEVIAGVQLVRPGDIVRIYLSEGRSVSYVVGVCAAVREAGEGRPCAFTGLPIRGQAIHCTCGLLMTEEAIAQLGQCPQCGHELNPEAGTRSLPPEELL